VNFALQPVSVFGSGVPLDSRVDRDSLVKTEFELNAPSLTMQPVTESLVHTSKEEQLLCKEEKQEQFTMPLTSASVVSDRTAVGLSASTVPFSVPTTRCKTESTDILSSLFCPTIVDVRSVKIEPEGVHNVPMSSSVVLTGASGSSIQSGCGQVEKLTATDLHYNEMSSHPSYSNSCITSDSSSSSSVVSCSSVSLRPLMSFADSTSSGITSTSAADRRVSHSSLSAVVKKEFSSPERSCSTAAEDTVPPLNCAEISARNSTESSGVRSTKFADNELTACRRVTRADDVGDAKYRSRHKTVKTVASSSDSVSTRDKTVVLCTNDTDSSKHGYSKVANVDGSAKGKHVPSVGRQKSDTESFHGAVSFHSEKESKMSSAMPNVESRKRTYPSTAKTGGMCVYCYQLM